jgi:exonuclease-1
MDECGMGTLVDLTDLPKLTDLRMHEFTMEKFKQMCILSGCDYLPSIKGVGLKTANKLMRKHSTIEKVRQSTNYCAVTNLISIGNRMGPSKIKG